jgi:hypothetical protein
MRYSLCEEADDRADKNQPKQRSIDKKRKHYDITSTVKNSPFTFEEGNSSK